MSAIIERDFSFQAGVYFNNTVLFNLYDFTVQMEVDTDDIREQNVAMDRIKYFVYECLDGVIFIQDIEDKAIEKFMDCGFRICQLPDEPYDQVIGLLILYKFNAICESKLLMTDIVFTSKLSDGVKFKENVATALNTFKNTGWWAQNNCNYNKIKTSKKDKVVKLVSKNDWNDLGLSWHEVKNNATQIIFAPETEK